MTINYRRLPNRLGSFRGTLLAENRNRLVIAQRLRVRNPRRVFGKVVAANGYLAVWFIFRGKWYDASKFFDRKGVFAGYYCDIIQPVARLLAEPSKTSVITDLFLDLWISREGDYMALDEDELDHALAKRLISTPLARRARRELRELIHLTRAGRFPTRAIRRFEPPPRSLDELE